MFNDLRSTCGKYSVKQNSHTKRYDVRISDVLVYSSITKADALAFVSHAVMFTDEQAQAYWDSISESIAVEKEQDALKVELEEERVKLEEERVNAIEHMETVGAD